MMDRKRMAGAALIAMASVLFVACGNVSENMTESVTETVTESAVTENTELHDKETESTETENKVQEKKEPADKKEEKSDAKKNTKEKNTSSKKEAKSEKEEKNNTNKKENTKSTKKKNSIKKTDNTKKNNKTSKKENTTDKKEEKKEETVSTDLKSGIYEIDMSWSPMAGMLVPMLEIDAKKMTFSLYNKSEPDVSKGKGKIEYKAGIYTMKYGDRAETTDFMYSKGIITFTSLMYYGSATITRVDDNGEFLSFTAGK